ncbi:putative GntR family transcriptional regulator [Rhizobium freirei PRF 81]|uniref:Putative GntR family transcriptional regulator n=1 Tax=Rhizobium freirei PRF 81 TaxID=363754 RepID=N6V4V8_9HYPH|nr:PLP-dependent aminotransferase family protein [Rhizobium freirei]ENN88156.1 putative GntR family transcriptional regulator [Rhizobium freirei PRF 81]
MKNWHPDLSRSANPRYIAIADLIEMDLRSGVLVAGDRLPPQRELAKRLGVDFTTVARGYVEAQKRGLVDSHVGRGTFVTGSTGAERGGFVSDLTPDPRRASAVDFSMNLPPDVTDPEIIARMREGMSAVAANLVSLLRYQDFGGSGMDREAAAVWLGRRGLTPPPERIFITPGAHPTLLAIFGLLARPGDVVLSENVTYAGMRSIAAQLRLNLVGLAMDEQGILPDAFAAACEKTRPKALYLNPTLQNPLTLTIPEGRRREIAAVARRYQVPIVEDDAYGFIPSHGPQPIAAIAPDLTWHIGGLAKCIGAGLRLACTVVPEGKAVWPFVSAMRTGNVMASPVTMALATRWIEDGTADAILRFIRTEAAVRQSMVASAFPAGSYQADPISFNIWLPLTDGWTRSTFSNHVRNSGIGVVASDAFTVEGPAPEAVRICLGGPIGRDRLKGALDFMAHALEGPPEMAASVF